MNRLPAALFAAAVLGVSGTAHATGSGSTGGTCDLGIQINSQQPYLIHNGQSLWSVWQLGNRGAGDCTGVQIRCGYTHALLERKAVHLWGGFDHGDVTAPWKGKGRFTSFWIGKSNPITVAPGQNWNYAVVLQASGKVGAVGQMDCHVYYDQGKTQDWHKVMITPC